MKPTLGTGLGLTHIHTHPLFPPLPSPPPQPQHTQCVITQRSLTIQLKVLLFTARESTQSLHCQHTGCRSVSCQCTHPKGYGVLHIWEYSYHRLTNLLNLYTSYGTCAKTIARLRFTPYQALINVTYIIIIMYSRDITALKVNNPPPPPPPLSLSLSLSLYVSVIPASLLFPSTQAYSLQSQGPTYT